MYFTTSANANTIIGAANWSAVGTSFTRWAAVAAQRNRLAQNSISSSSDPLWRQSKGGSDCRWGSFAFPVFPVESGFFSFLAL